MGRHIKDGKTTRHRLLESAAIVFAEQGFHHATVKEICRQAQANIAAVNYHFHSKVELYREAWKHSFVRAGEKYAAMGQVPENASAKERLFRWIQHLVYRLADRENYAYLIAQKEMAGPTALLKDVMRECIAPLRQNLMEIVRDLLGKGAPDQRVHFCVASVLGQCLGTIRRIRMAELRGGPILENDPLVQEIREDLDQFIQHVYEFSLAGIESLGHHHT